MIAVTDAAGSVIAVNRYDEYGVPAAGNQGRFQYTGQAWLPELGMYHYKARIYSSRLGRFLQVDPIGYDDQVNLYAYVGNDPVNGTDPTGTCDTGSRLPGGSTFCKVLDGFRYLADKAKNAYNGGKEMVEDAKRHGDAARCNHRLDR